MKFKKEIEYALQGVVHWLGHRRSIFHDYHVGESALVAELTNLLHAHVASSNNAVRCEYKYKKISNSLEFDDDLSKNARVDIVILKDKSVESIFEVKRATSSKRIIEKDLIRLAKVKNKFPEIETFLIIISEAKCPKDYVSENGTAKNGKWALKKSGSHWKVRRVKKSAHSFASIGRANFSCLIEVY